jgi:hypothetical protein
MLTSIHMESCVAAIKVLVLGEFSFSPLRPSHQTHLSHLGQNQKRGLRGCNVVALTLPTKRMQI